MFPSSFHRGKNTARTIQISHCFRVESSILTIFDKFFWVQAILVRFQQCSRRLAYAPRYFRYLHPNQRDVAKEYVRYTHYIMCWSEENWLRICRSKFKITKQGLTSSSEHLARKIDGNGQIFLVSVRKLRYFIEVDASSARRTFIRRPHGTIYNNT